MRSSTAAGCTGTTKTFGESGVEGQIGLARIGIRPAGITLEHLTPEIIRDTEALECTETPDALAPVLLLRAASQSRSTSSRIPLVITRVLYGRLLPEPALGPWA